MDDNFEEKRSEPRKVINQFYSVDFSAGDDPFVYQFKIWNVSSKGACLIVKEDSSVLTHFKVGEIIKMRYYKEDVPASGEYLNTKIIYINKQESGQFKGHCLIGISILDAPSSL